MEKILNIAHRGASAYAYENTFGSIEKAIQLGADMVEFDLRRTGDGVIVLWHDEKVLNSNRKWTPVSNIAFNDLDILSKKSGFRLARFDEVLKEFGSLIAFDIEIKTAGFEEEVVYLLKRYPPHFPPTISSFHLNVLRKIKKLDCSLKADLVLGNSRFLKSAYFGRSIIKRLALKSKASTIHLNLGIASEPIINELTELGFDLYIWTVNDKSDMKNLISMGVDGIITDKPDVLNSIRDSSAERKLDFSKEEIG
ncbi:MAG: glycerophosphodiester phosphodiesterase [Candidatus Zixiibacteriota bacterium]|nr:MAG: glycerophosphodiester phosphodiesterase [candidate division Zixibacteria bacterium]